jgi:hypothetical protein
MSISEFEAEFAASFYDHVYNHPNHPPSEELLRLYLRDQKRVRRERRLRHLDGMGKAAPVILASEEFVRGWPPIRKPGPERILRRAGVRRTPIALHHSSGGGGGMSGCQAPFTQLAQTTSTQGYTLGSNETEYVYPGQPDQYGFYRESIKTIASQGIYSIAGYTDNVSQPKFTTFGNLEGLAPTVSITQGYFLPQIASLNPVALLFSAQLSRPFAATGVGLKGCVQPGLSTDIANGLVWPIGFADLTATVYQGLPIFPGAMPQTQTATDKELLISIQAYGDPNGPYQTYDDNNQEYNYSVDVLQDDMFTEPGGVSLSALLKRPSEKGLFIVVEVSISYYFWRWKGNTDSGVGLENRLPTPEVQLAVPGDPWWFGAQPITLNSIQICYL